MMHPRALLALVLGAVAALAPSQSPCGSHGLTLSVNSNRIGDNLALTIAGPASAPGLLGIDVSGGPAASPVGPVCLGLTPIFQTLAFTLSAAGTFTIGASTAPSPTLNGFELYLQAAAVDALQPTGFAVSNGWHERLRPPRLYLYNQFFLAVTSAGQIPIWDTLGDFMSGLIQLPPCTLRQVVAVPQLDWVVAGLQDGILPGPTVKAYSGVTGLPVMSIPLPTIPTWIQKLALSGTTLAVLMRAPGSGYSALYSYDLLTGAPGPSMPFAGEANDMFAIPGTSIVYVAGPGWIAPVDLTGTTTIPPIVLPTSADQATEMKMQGNLLYCVISQGLSVPVGLHVIDVTTHTALFPSPLFAGAGLILPRFRPGVAGPYLVDPLGVFGHVDPTNWSWTPIQTATGAANIAMSAGGNEAWIWCFLGVGGCPSPTLKIYDFGTNTFTTFASLTTSDEVDTLATIPSASLRKAYIASSNGSIRIFQTDPPMALGSSPLPFNVLSVAVD